MKRVAYYGKRDLRIEEVKVPDITPDKLLIKICWCGVCGSEGHLLEGEIPNVPLPYFPGHEFSGIVEKVGERVKYLRQGDRVVGIPFIVSCDDCYFCKMGKAHFCSNARIAQGYGFSEYTLLSPKQVFKIPSHISLQIAALTEPLSIAVRAVDQAGIRSGDTVSIIGGGTMGLLILHLALISGAKLIVLSDPVKKRRTLAREIGTHVVVDPVKEDLLEIIKEYTQGLGVDVSFEAAGFPSTYEQAVDLPKKGGKVVFVGVIYSNENVKLKPLDIHAKELTIENVHINFNTYSRAINLLDKLHLQPLITHRFPLVNIQEAMECFKKEKERIKILVQCSEVLIE